MIHTYQKYDAARFPSPTAPPPDVVSGAFEHLLRFGSARDLTPEQLANAVHLDPSQIAGLGPSLEALIELLEARKRKILATYETKKVKKTAESAFTDKAASLTPPERMAKHFDSEVRAEHLRGLEQIWYHVDDQSPFSIGMIHLIERLGEKYQVDELAAKYDFTGRKPMTVPEALKIKEELEKIDELLQQLREAMENAQVGLIDMEALAQYAEPGDMDNLRALQQQVEDYLREEAKRQGLEFTAEGYRLTPKAYRLFQGRLLEEIFSDLDAARSGRHTGPIVGEGAVEMPRTKAYEFGDSVTHMDVAQSMINAMLRDGPGTPVRMRPEDIEIHETRNNPKCATTVVMDMSGSMRYDGQYINCKRMALALDGLIRSEYPGDYLQFIEMYTFAKPCAIAEVPALMPKPVTVYDSIVRLKADMSDDRITEFDLPPHFTNIQHSLRLSRRFLQGQNTPNRQIILITDGLPTAHFEEEMLLLLYPPDPRTEQQTMREALLCAREGITINIFLLPNWGQTSEDVQFAHRMAETTKGRVFFTGGRDLDRYVVWDYVKQRRKIIG